jgi:hypothetical protein
MTGRIGRNVGWGGWLDRVTERGMFLGVYLCDGTKHRRWGGTIQMTRYLLILGSLEWSNAGPGQIDIMGIARVITNGRQRARRGRTRRGLPG